eukprot:405176_1
MYGKNSNDNNVYMSLTRCNGFALDIPDCIGFLYYLNRGLAGHVDYPQFSKMITIYKIFESVVGGKMFGWTYKSNKNEYLLQNLVVRHLKPGGSISFFGPFALIFNHGVSTVLGECGMLSHRWQTMMSIIASMAK